jgi:hypothetical protein
LVCAIANIAAALVAFALREERAEGSGGPLDVNDASVVTKL